MEAKKYDWIQKGFAKGIDPDEAVKELERIEANYGALTPENILDAATPEDALFHPLFTWNNSEAARLYRLQEARHILNNIEVRIIHDGKEKHIPVFEVVKRPEGRVYKHVDSFTKEDILQVKSDAVRAFNYWKSKLAVYKEFEAIIPKIDEVLSEIK
jgi:hypothetical protein